MIVAGVVRHVGTRPGLRPTRFFHLFAALVRFLKTRRNGDLAVVSFLFRFCFDVPTANAPNFVVCENTVRVLNAVDKLFVRKFGLPLV